MKLIYLTDTAEDIRSDITNLREALVENYTLRENMYLHPFGPGT